MSNKVISLFIKSTIAGLSLWYIYEKITGQGDHTTIIRELKTTFTDSTSLKLLLPLVLMFLNWSLEALKWKMIMEQVEPITFTKALKAIITGVTMSIFTPNRVGEFSGRIFFLKQENRKIAIPLTFLGNASQLLVTLVAGTLALIVYLPVYTSLNSQPSIYYLIFLLVILVNIALILAYFNVSFLSRFWKYLEILNHYSFRQLSKIVSLSLFRYVIFSLQFYLLLQLFGININPSRAIIMIALTFFSITVIPTITLTEPGVRGSAALTFIGLLSANTIGIVAATFSLWLINIVFPAILGIVFLFQLKFFKSAND